MRRPSSKLLIFGIATASFALVYAQDTAAKQEQTCEQVFKNIQVFKGVPASDLIPAMEFMSASLKYECTDCHDAKDYAAETRAKETTRNMVIMQREINAKNFNNRPTVTCMSCHRGAERPVAAPFPEGITTRHQRVADAPKPADLFAKAITAAGKTDGAIVRTGTLTAPDDATHKVETKPLEFIQASGGKYKLVSGDRKAVSDGKQSWYGGNLLNGEPEAIFGRIGRAWRGEDAFAGLERTTVSGKDEVAKSPVFVVRGNRSSTSSMEELYFDSKSDLLVRLVNARASSLGTVITAIDYSNFQTVGSAKVPMKVVVTFAGGQQWVMEFTSAKVDANVKDSTFTPGG